MDDATLIARWNAGASYGVLSREAGVTPQILTGRIARLRRAGVALRFGPPVKVLKIRPTQLLCEEMDLFTLGPDDCRYMVGPNKFCKQPVQYKSYCEPHAKLCYAPARIAAADKHGRDTSGNPA